MLALILTHPRPIEKSTVKECKGTLLIVPLALVDQWRLEIAEKTTLKSYVHHGPKRESDPNRLIKFDVVITTYDTVSSELYSKGKEASVNRRGVFLVNWWRIVLGMPSLHMSHNRRSAYHQESQGENVDGMLCSLRKI